MWDRGQEASTGWVPQASMLLRTGNALLKALGTKKEESLTLYLGWGLFELSAALLRRMRRFGLSAAGYWAPARGQQCVTAAQWPPLLLTTAMCSECETRDHTKWTCTHSCTQACAHAQRSMHSFTTVQFFHTQLCLAPLTSPVSRRMDFRHPHWQASSHCYTFFFPFQNPLPRECLSSPSQENMQKICWLFLPDKDMRLLCVCWSESAQFQNKWASSRWSHANVQWINQILLPKRHDDAFCMQLINRTFLNKW